MLRASEMLWAEWSMEWKAYVWNSPLPWISGIGYENRNQLMPLLLFPVSRVNFSQQLILKEGKILNRQRRRSYTRPKLYNLLGRLFREIRILKASIHNPKIQDGNPNCYEKPPYTLSVWNDPMSIGSGCQSAGGSSCCCRCRCCSSQRAGQS